MTLSGCPDGAELENPEQNMQYPGGTAGVGVGGATAGTAGVGVGGATGGAGAAQGGSAGTAPVGGAGAGGTAGGAGTGSGTWVWNCGGEVAAALKQNCSRPGCHVTTLPYADLDFTDPTTLRAKMVDQPATFGDIGCNMPGTAFRECTPEEALGLGCPPNAKLIDSQNFDASWVVKKINGDQGDCGDAMPISPGNSASNGWDAEGMRKQCYIDFFRSLIGTQ